MEPISTAIIAALLAGAGNAAKDVAGAAVKDAYSGIKAIIQRKFDAGSDTCEALARLEAKPESKGWQEELAGALDREGAGADQDLAQAARRLIQALEASPSGQTHIQKIVGNYNAMADRGGIANVTVTRKD